MSRRAMLVGLAVAFVLGVSLGFNGGLLFSHHAGPGLFGPPRPPFDDGPRGPRGGPRFGDLPGPPIEHLRRVLELSDEQVERIRARIDATRDHTQAMRESLRVAIEAELTPEQRERWRSLQPRHRNPGDNRGRRPAPEGDER